MISFLIKYKNVFLILTIVFFLGSLGFVGAGVFMEEYGPNAAVAKIGKGKIKYKDYTTAVNLMDRQMRGEDNYNENTLKQIKQQVLQTMINEESLAQSAAKFGMGVSDLEIAYTIRNSPLFNKNGLFNKTAYVWLVRNNFGMNPAEYENTLSKQKLAAKFQNVLILSAKTTPQEVKMLYKSQGKKDAEIDKNLDAMALAAMEIKAQALANQFTRQFNETETVEIFDKGLQ
ncbi:MAG: SurA N-terminal domain-containing protein [Elusimicrobiota bacterium]|jgi:peptidyl-prolyl cis-trans isomerase D|nr:SurA N-terminal domain-containing protein [Elusimicrobiota bacterium]